MRITKLLEMLQNEPDDPFLMYAIALEYQKSEPMKAVQYFETLLNRHENYLPTYYQAASLFADLGNREQAKAVFLKGIQMATLKNDKHTRQELQNAFSDFLSDDL